VVSDLDATIFKNNLTVSRRTLNVVQQLRAREIYTAVAAARRRRNLVGDSMFPPELRDPYLICYNGAELYRDGRLARQKYIDSKASKQVVNWLLSNAEEARVFGEPDGKLYELRRRLGFA